jgi:preprotein translocase subunit SecE
MGDTVKERTGKGDWFKGLKAEFHNIIWPDKRTLTRETAAVVVVSVLLGMIIAALDFVIRFGLEFIIK